MGSEEARVRSHPEEVIKVKDDAGYTRTKEVEIGRKRSIWLSHIQLIVTPWTPLTMEFSQQEYWSGLPFPHPGDLPEPGIEPMHLLHCRQILYH